MTNLRIFPLGNEMCVWILVIVYVFNVYGEC